MSEQEPNTSTTVAGGVHKGDETGSDQAHGGDALGAVDLTAWAYALAGAVLGALTVLALIAARGT